jgi:hypothetical protein
MSMSLARCVARKVTVKESSERFTTSSEMAAGMVPQSRSRTAT